MRAARIPHFDLPFRFHGDTVAVVEQDTLDEIAVCCEAILRCPAGFRVEKPAFGNPDQTFHVRIDDARISAAIAEWEPRAVDAISDSLSATSTLVREVEARITKREASSS